MGKSFGCMTTAKTMFQKLAKFVILFVILNEAQQNEASL